MLPIFLYMAPLFYIRSTYGFGLVGDGGVNNNFIMSQMEHLYPAMLMLWASYLYTCGCAASLVWEEENELIQGLAAVSAATAVL